MPAGQPRHVLRVIGPEGCSGNVNTVNLPDGPNLLAAGAGSCCTLVVR
jgi:hypothetical protein